MSNKFIFYFLSLVILPAKLLAVSNLSKADSLFQEKKYTEAFEIYQDIYNSGNASEAMLIKMAFIQEGLDNYVDAIVYLSKYGDLTGDKDAYQKIEQIAEEYQLSGFEYSDDDFVFSKLKLYNNYLLALLASIVILQLAMIVRKRKTGSTGITTFIFLIITCASLLYLNNFSIQSKTGIIANDNTLVMSGPSSGSEPVDLITKGHKIELIEESPIWLKVMWRGEESYIKRTQIIVLS